MLDLGLAGLAGLALALFQRRLRHDIAGLPSAYLLTCGGCFVFYQVCLLLAIGLAEDGPQVIVAAMLNYLWPSLTLVFAVLLLKWRWRLWLLPGLALTIAGEMLVVGARLWADRATGLPMGVTETVIYALGLAAGISWALYSVLSHKLAHAQEGDATPLFMLASAIAIAPVALWSAEKPHFTTVTFLALAFSALLPGLLAYSWWDRGMRLGNAKVLTIVSYLIPLGSTVATSIVVRTWPQWPVWAGASLVIAGSLICHYSVSTPPHPTADAPQPAQ
jgi:drug/metabolite transporter (DMT)-like permease